MSALFLGTLLLAQGELDEEDKIYYRDEKTGGINLNSNGYSLNYRYGKRIDGYKKRLYLIDLSEIKDAKELKRNNQSYPNYERFVYGKQNVVFSLKGGTGRMNELYSKRDKNGIAIRRFYIYGATIAFEKPIYYEIFSQNVSTLDTFDPAVHRIDNITGKASFFKGVSEASLIPGAFASYGYSFEYSLKEGIVKSFEVGVMGEFYIRSVVIMGDGASKPWFLTLFLTYRFGKIKSAFD